MRHHALASKDGDLVWSSPIAKHIFKEKCGGKPIIIKLDEEISREARGFYWGAVVTAWFYLNPAAKWTSKDEAHENLKLQFNPVWINDIQGIKQKYPGSSEDFTREDYRLKWIEPICRHIEENYKVLLDSEDWKRFDGSVARFEGEEYPQTKLLREEYEVKYKEMYPWAEIPKI